jgi:hypothetical protein
MIKHKQQENTPKAHTEAENGKPEPEYEEVYYEKRGNRNSNAPEYITLKMDINRALPNERFIKSTACKYYLVADQNRLECYISNNKRRREMKQQKNAPSMHFQQLYLRNRQATETHDHIDRQSRDNEESSRNAHLTNQKTIHPQHQAEEREAEQPRNAHPPLQHAHKRGHPNHYQRSASESAQSPRSFDKESRDLNRAEQRRSNTINHDRPTGEERRAHDYSPSHSTAQNQGHHVPADAVTKHQQQSSPSTEEEAGAVKPFVTHYRQTRSRCAEQSAQNDPHTHEHRESANSPIISEDEEMYDYDEQAWKKVDKPAKKGRGRPKKHINEDKLSATETVMMADSIMQTAFPLFQQNQVIRANPAYGRNHLFRQSKCKHNPA